MDLVDFILPNIRAGGVWRASDEVCDSEARQFSYKWRAAEHVATRCAIEEQMRASAPTARERGVAQVDLEVRSAQGFRRDVEEHIWCRPGVEASLLPAGAADFLIVSQQDAQALIEHQLIEHESRYDFLELAWNVVRGRVVVKGGASGEAFPYSPEQGPTCK